MPTMFDKHRHCRLYYVCYSAPVIIMHWKRQTFGMLRGYGSLGPFILNPPMWLREDTEVIYIIIW